jgi:hypothetical protein
MGHKVCKCTTLLSIIVHISLDVGPIDLKSSAFERKLNSTQNVCILAGLFSEDWLGYEMEMSKMGFGVV